MVVADSSTHMHYLGAVIADATAFSVFLSGQSMKSVKNPLILGVVTSDIPSRGARRFFWAAQCLNERGLRTATGLRFNAATIGDLRRKYRLKSRHQRLCDAGLKPLTKIAADLHIGIEKLHDWRAKGLLQLKSHRVIGQRYLYEIPADWPERITPSRSAEISSVKS